MPTSTRLALQRATTRVTRSQKTAKKEATQPLRTRVSMRVKGESPKRKKTEPMTAKKVSKGGDVSAETNQDDDVKDNDNKEEQQLPNHEHVEEEEDKDDGDDVVNEEAQHESNNNETK